MTDSANSDWLLLAASLPGQGASTARVRLWRALKDVGAMNLRDGVTLVPSSAATRASFAEIVKAVEAEGGSAWTFLVPRQAPAVEKKLRALFDRAEAYGELTPATTALRAAIAAGDEATVRRRYRHLEREFRAIAALDFFPGSAQTRLSATLEKLRSSVDRRFSPAEPSRSEGAIERRDIRAFQGARWATRKRLWVDRAASAWLIRRFIDRDAKFDWLDSPADCPRDAHGFDFNGAAFTHVGDSVTFEVLRTAFGLDADRGLDGLGRLVHYLDIGGDFVPEASGFEAVLSGLRDSAADDDALLEKVTPVLDALYRHFATHALGTPK